MATTHHDHVNRSGAALADAARKTLIAAGEQWTDMRSTVFDALSSFEQPASAYDIAERVGTALGRRIAPNSVYRILDLFVGANLALRVESRNAYLANSHPDCVHDCIFLVCDGCGLTTHLDDEVVASMVRRLAVKDGFVPKRPVIEVHGYCRNCAAKA
jgi:Fur family zinc uptake transcriptional regulator